MQRQNIKKSIKAHRSRGTTMSINKNKRNKGLQSGIEKHIVNWRGLRIDIEISRC